MNPATMDIDLLIPHRRPMRLVDTVLEVGDRTATTSATVDRSWPLTQARASSPIVLIELAAQTAGICIGHRERLIAGGDPEGKGWLVGIKHARFHVEDLPAGARVVVRTARRFTFEKLTEIEATAIVDGRHAGDIVLQLMQSDSVLNPEPTGEKVTNAGNELK